MLRKSIAAMLLLAFPSTCRADAADVGATVKTSTSTSVVGASIALRGYGKIASRFQELKQPAGASLLQIDCESVARAQLVQAKYLSDLGLLPGVKRVSLANNLQAGEIEGQGAVCALRDGKRVLMLTAPTSAALMQVVASQTRAAGGRAMASRPHAEVPMWLDRWDKFGFRFYYRPWMMPKTGDGDQTGYDITQEFEWARQQDRSGLVFWDHQMQVDTGEGLMTHASWDWAQAWSKNKGLPVAINDAAGFGPPSWMANRYREENAQVMPGFLGTMHRVGDYGMGGVGWFSSSAGRARDAELGLLQSSVRRWAKDENVTTFLEPHGELRHGAHSLFLEYGPVADAGYGRFLREKYVSVANVNARWKTNYTSWNAVRVPELASFAGWGKDALDLSGTWRVRYDEEGKTALGTSFYDAPRDAALGRVGSFEFAAGRNQCSRVAIAARNAGLSRLSFAPGAAALSRFGAVA